MARKNRLAAEVSPYLVQHADNPVDWWPWGAAAFAHAKASDKPVLLSVGYSACHWCHVMAHESFEDAETAAVMNDLFVNIKVDREERPDVDHVYMQSLHALGEQGGWPLTMFLDPDGRPFWGGTYFPKTARYGRPGFKDVLRNIAVAYRTRKDDLNQNAEAILGSLAGSEAAPPSGLGLRLLDELGPRIRDVYDPVHGGLRGAPKFPNPGVLEFLWRTADRTGDESIRAPFLKTLDRMCRGGIFDHVGGGFARYSVDERWLVPHFEKMLYDNAQLLPLLALAARDTGAEVYRDAAEQTVAWLAREMTAASGAFCASQDADSLNPDGHAEEGAFYIWTPEEIGAALGEERARQFCAAYDITSRGNFESRNIPNRLHVDGRAGVHDDDRAALSTLRAVRSARPAPGLDDKVLADWNGLMIVGLVRAGEILGHADWLAMAQRAFFAVVHHLGGESILGHAYRAGKVVRPGFATDHAAMTLAAVTLYEATGNAGFLRQAETWARSLIERYHTDTGLLAMTVAEADDLPLRPAPTADDATPNANGLAAESFIRLFGLTGNPVWLEAADDTIGSASSAILANPFGHASLLNALDLRLRRADITISADKTSDLTTVLQNVPYPNRTLANLTLGAERPLTVTEAGSRGAYAMVCSAGQCSLPLHTAAEFRARIEEAVHKGRPPRAT